MEYVSSKEAQKYFNVSGNTLRRWANTGKIKTITTKGKHRRYLLPKFNTNGHKYIYARVSSNKQTTNLQNQINFLKKLYPTHTIIKDIASGMNFNRDGIIFILEQVFEKKVTEVVVYSSDRLTRFSNQLLKFIFDYFGTKLIIVNKKDYKFDTEELADDLMTIVTVFAAKIHGERRYDTKNK